MCQMAYYKSLTLFYLKVTKMANLKDVSKVIEKYFSPTRYSDTKDGMTYAVIQEEVLTSDKIKDLNNLIEDLAKIGIELVCLDINPLDININIRINEEHNKKKTSYTVFDNGFRLIWKGSTVKDEFMSFYD